MVEVPRIGGIVRAAACECAALTEPVSSVPQTLILPGARAELSHWGAGSLPDSYSIVIPCRNAASWIGQCVASCIQQDSLPSEIILVDDGSTDDSAAIVGDMALPASVLLRIIREDGIGSARARGAGAREATGHWLLFLDADDELAPNAVGKLLSRAGSGDVVHGDVVLTDSSGTARESRSMAPDTSHPVASVLFKSPYCGTALVRRDAHQPWDASHDAVDEFYYFANLAMRGRKFVHVPEVVLRYRQHASPARKSNLGFDYGTALASAFASLWNTCVNEGLADEDLRAYIAWIMADLTLRASRGEARNAVAAHARALRSYRWRRLGFALRHYGVRRVARLLTAWPRP